MMDLPTILINAINLFNEKRFADASALLADQEHPYALLIKAHIARYTTSLNDAILILEQAVTLDPNFVDGLTDLGGFLLHSGSQHNWGKGRQFLLRALAISPENVKAMTCLGELNWVSAQIQDALNVLNKAIELEPDNARAHYLLSQVHGQEGNAEHAHYHLEKYANYGEGISESTRLDLLDLSEIKSKKDKKSKKSRYPSTKIMKGEFDDFFSYEFSRYFSSVPKFIHQKTKFFTLGSCFAREISKSLTASGFSSQHLEVTEAVNTTFANRLLIDWLKGDLKGAAAERIQELAQTLGSREKIIDAFTHTDVFIFTMGVAPVFFDRVTGEFVMPRYTSINNHALAEKFEFRTTTVDENVSNVVHILDYLKSINPNARIFLTISPVPLGMTFEYDSAMMADCVSKSVLRVAADIIVKMKISNIYYWPSFEIVRWAGGHNGPVFGVDDDSEFHVAEKLIGNITSKFISTFSEKTSLY